jgi:hypothetical protein
MELPHVPAPQGHDGVPPGEGCYSCNVNAEGIPLQQPRRAPQYLRVRRSTGDQEEYLEQEVIILIIVLLK